MEDVALGGVANLEVDHSLHVRAGDEAHVGVAGIGVVNGEPDGAGLGGRDGPVGCVLVPGDLFAVVGHLAEEVRAPADDVFAEQVADVGNHAGVGEEVPRDAVFEVRGADRIAVFAGGGIFGEEAVEFGPDSLDFSRRKYL